MHKLYDLKEMLCEELEKYGAKDKMNTGDLDVVDKLAHAIKNIDKILAEKDAYSGYMPRDGVYRTDGMSYRDESFARGRGARRDAMGRYSRAESDFRADLQELMHDAPNDHIRQKIQSIMNEM